MPVLKINLAPRTDYRILRVVGREGVKRSPTIKPCDNATQALFP